MAKVSQGSKGRKAVSVTGEEGLIEDDKQLDTESQLEGGGGE